jgi:hypothetical protein
MNYFRSVQSAFLRFFFATLGWSLRLSVTDSDPACHFDEDPDPDTTFHFDPDPTFYFDANPDLGFKIKAQNLDKSAQIDLYSIHFGLSLRRLM